MSAARITIIHYVAILHVHAWLVMINMMACSDNTMPLIIYYQFLQGRARVSQKAKSLNYRWSPTQKITYTKINEIDQLYNLEEMR